MQYVKDIFQYLYEVLGEINGCIIGNSISVEGFATFQKLKDFLGTKLGYEWHHIVGQTQIQRSGYLAMVHNTGNMI